MLSQKAKYALRALLTLAEAPERSAVLISDIAHSDNIPKKFLEQILLELKHRGIVQSKRGRGGGYALLKPPGEIAIGEVVRLIDGPLAPLPCLSRVAYRKVQALPRRGHLRPPADVRCEPRRRREGARPDVARRCARRRQGAAGFEHAPGSMTRSSAPSSASTIRARDGPGWASGSAHEQPGARTGATQPRLRYRAVSRAICPAVEHDRGRRAS